MVSVSVVVPTYKRSPVVMRCLDSVQQQTLAGFELLLVDNSPDAELEARIERFNQGARTKVRYIPEPRLGLHNARAMCWCSLTMTLPSIPTGWRRTRAASARIPRWPPPVVPYAQPGKRHRRPG